MLDGMTRGAGDVRRRNATAAMAGVALYAAVDVVLQRLPPRYSAISDSESSLAVGPFGWIMNLNFLGRAATTGCALVAIARTGPPSPLRSVGLALTAMGGASSAALAFFPTDVAGPGAGPGAGLVATTPVGKIHLAIASAGFVAALGGFGVLTAWTRRTPGLRRVASAAEVAVGTATGGLVSVVLAIAFVPRVVGLAERVCLAGILGWVWVVCGGIRQLR